MEIVLLWFFYIPLVLNVCVLIPALIYVNRTLIIELERQTRYDFLKYITLSWVPMITVFITIGLICMIVEGIMENPILGKRFSEWLKGTV